MARSRFLSTLLIIVACTLSACAGGGGTSASTTGGGNNLIPVNTTINQFYVPGWRGPFPAASQNGPKLSDPDFPTTSTTFNLEELGAGYQGAVLGGADNYHSQLIATKDGLRLIIPPLGIDTMIEENSPMQVGNGTLRFTSSSGDYAIVGTWQYQTSDTVNLSFFFTGYAIPDTNVPLLGQADYAGTTVGMAFLASGNTIKGAPITGDATLTVDFTNETFSGRLTNMSATYNHQTSAWNDISFSGEIATYLSNGDGTLVGTSQVTSAPNTTYAMSASGSGGISGQLFGPTGEETAAVWWINDNKYHSAGGVFGVQRTGTSAASKDVAPFTNTLPSNPGTTAGTPSVGTPDAAAKDSTIAKLEAMPGGPNFTGTGGDYPDGLLGTIRFPARLTALQFTNAGVVGATDATGATIIVDQNSSNLKRATEITAYIPALGLNLEIPLTGFSGATGYVADPLAGDVIGYATAKFGLEYTALGAWLEPTFTPPNTTGYFAFGYETPVSNVPTSGTGTYAGNGTVVGTVLRPDGDTVDEAVVGGDAALTADFGTGAISGTFTNMHSYTSTNTDVWNDVSVTGAIGAGTNSFSGSTQTTNAPAGHYALKDTATGHIDGDFYGPNADELGAVWTLSNGDGTGSAIGAVGATKQ